MAVQLVGDASDAGNAGDAGNVSDVRRSGETPPPAPLKMPASPERAARDIAAAGVEGRPADASSGPKMLRLEMLGIALGIVAVAVAMGIWVNWMVGVVMLAVGLAALVFNPVMGAAAMRSKERQDVADMERGARNSSSEGGSR